MKVKMYCREGQIYCYDCGNKFELNFIPIAEPSRYIMTKCPNPECNRGSWATFEPTEDFTIPVEFDLTKARRRIEDRLRKDHNYLVQVIRQVG